MKLCKLTIKTSKWINFPQGKNIDSRKTPEKTK